MLSQAVGKPVRVQLSRKDEMAWENYGNLFAIDQRAGLDASGTIVAWDYEAWSAAKGGRPGYNTPGNVVTGTLLGLNPAPFNPRTPAPAPTQPLNNNLQYRAVVYRRTRARLAERRRSRRAVNVCSRIASGRRSSPDRCAHRNGCRTRSRTSASWTKWRRT